MKKTITVLAMTIVAMLFTANRAHTYESGAPAGQTGSPGDGGMSCNSAYCHNGPAATDEEVLISSSEVDNREYQIVVEAKSTTSAQYVKAGFQACVEDADGNKIGEIVITNSSTTKIVDQHYITHKTAGTQPSPEVFNSYHLWKFDWIAPAEFTGEATIYAASMLTNNNGDYTGDVHVLGSHTIDVGLGQEEVLEDKFKVYPNPTSELIHIDLEGYLGEKVSVDLVDIKGSTKKLFEGVVENGVFEYQIPASISEGVYMLCLSSKEDKISTSIVIK